MLRLSLGVLLCVSLSFAAPTARLETSLQGVSVESASQQARSAGVAAEVEASLPLREWLASQARAGVLIETGAHRARYNDEFAPRQGLRVREASVSILPFPGGSLSLGALDQNRWDYPLLVRDQSFPGALERMGIQRSAWSMTLAAQQSFVTDSSMVQPWGDWQPSPGSFFLERLEARFELAPDRFVSWSLGHYAFSSLSSTLADKSRFLGNQIEGFGPVQSRFAHPFQGFVTSVQSSWALGRWTPQLAATYLTNSAAPSEATSWQLRFGTHHRFSSEITAGLHAEFFELGSEAAPAAFNERALGHANRRGVGATLSVKLPKERSEITLRMVHSPGLSARPEQSDLDYAQIKFTLSSDLL